ncbi:MAG: four helix bundle protein [Candidatus Omnitrophica bacterium]|nr:four helix bundle protein [Candidatus Omnitrophota bacterium]
MRTHKDLKVWNKAIEYVTRLYKCTSIFPKEELYGLTTQIRRASVSVPSNIAEGAARTSNKEFMHFLFIAIGSLSELETQLIIAKNLGYINEALFDEIVSENEELAKMIHGLINFRKRQR